MNKTTLGLVGDHMDVVSLGRSCRASRLWKSAFENHRLWKVYYDENVEDKNANYRILFGERLNRSCLLIRNTWKITKIAPPDAISYFGEKISRLFMINQKIFYIANSILYIHPKTKIILPGEINDLYNPIEDCGFIYITTENGKILRWKRNEFPYFPEEVYQSQQNIERCQVKNGVFYISECDRPFEPLPCKLQAIENGKVLWERKLECGVRGDIQVNNCIGGALGAFHTGDLYLWDTKEKAEAKVVVSGVKKFVLLHNEAICLTGDGLFAYSLNHMREIRRKKFHNDAMLLVDKDRGEFFVLTSTYLISSHGEINFENLCITDARVFNGIIYATDQKACLMLISPKNGLIRKGNEKVLDGQYFNVYNGMVLGTQRDQGVILEPGKLKAIRKIK